MRLLGSLLIALLVVNFSNAQESSDRSVPPERGVAEFEAANISELNGSEIERAKGDQRSLAALEALAEGNDLWRSGEIEQSNACYQRAINLDPSFYAAQFNFGLTLLRLKEYGRAVLAFTEALRLRPESASAWQNLGFAHYHRKHYEKAAAAFREAQRLAPDEATTNSNLGFGFLFVSRFQDAITSFQKALQAEPRFGPAIVGLCTAQALGKNGAAAVQACLNAIRADSDSAVAHYHLGIAYMELGENEKARSTFKKAARIEPHTPRIHVGLGFACFKLTKYEEALKHFEQARRLSATAKHVLLGLGATYAELKDYEQAERTLREAVSSEPDNPIARFNLGMVCLARRNRDCALSQYNRLKIMDHALAKTLFTTMFRNRVVDASRFNKP